MIYPADVEQKLGFDLIRHKLKANCLSVAAHPRVDSITFLTRGDEIRELLHQNLEFKLLLEKGEEFPSRYFFDPSEWLQTISIEGLYLEEGQLLNLANSLETILLCCTFLKNNRTDYPALFSLTETVQISQQPVQFIRSKIDDQALVKDSASPELARIRKKLREEQSRLRKLTDQIFRRAVEERWVPEGALPTIREGRLVIPIAAEHKRRMRGFVLDESATGQTVFLEPAEMLDANNEIRELEHGERREVIRILKEITTFLRTHLPEIILAFDFLSLIDFIRAKAKFSREIDADLPQVSDSPTLSWQRARHPLLYLTLKGKRDVVPLEISLDEEDRMLLVSGPNAGGKSVCLKTVGLLQYMLQCGLLVPLSERSNMGIFQDILLDIGDQQSIENDLSTYSSHLRNMAAFIQSAGDRSLVLMDELGSGTDPNFGGAIAQAVLHSLLIKRTWGVATTHYYNLKLFAGQQPGIRNAAMRFDEKNLVPLYLLDIGKPGSSFALEIAQKTGLPAETLEEAERLVGKELAGFETLVRDLEMERQVLSEKLRENELRERQLQQTLKKYETLSAELETKKKQIIEKAKLEAQQLLRETNREIEKTIRHIRENKAEKKETLKVRKNLQSLTGKVAAEKVIKEPEQLKEGDRVRLPGQDSAGVIQVIKGKNAVVQFGELKSVVNLTKLEKITHTMTKEFNAGTAKKTFDMGSKRANFSHTLDVRGKRVEEVSSLLDQFMDTALLLGQGEVKILHGKGEGVLRKVVRDRLKQYKEVASFSDEHVERGGDGITVVILK